MEDINGKIVPVVMTFSDRDPGRHHHGNLKALWPLFKENWIQCFCIISYAHLACYICFIY